MFLLRLILFPFTPFYRLAVRLRNYLFDKGILKSLKVDAKVISVGNITVGGSGKTPAVIFLVELLKNSGCKVGVLSRGYGRETRGYLLVSDGKKIFSNSKQCGDEIYQTALECSVPAAVCEKRAEGAQRLIEDTGVDFIVLDDAFQHRWLHRDVDLLIFDQVFLSKVKGMDQNLLPIGMMREPFLSVKRSDAVIINRKFSEINYMPVELMPYFYGRKVFSSFYSACGIFDVKNQKYYSLDEFRGQRSLCVSGIARPQSFLNVLDRHNINTENQLIFRDHKSYSLKDIQLIRKKFYSTNSHSVITTEKDAVKLNEFSRELDDIDIYYLKIRLDIDEKNEFTEFLFEKLANKKAKS